MNEIQTNLRDRSLNLKMNYGGYKGLAAPSHVASNSYNAQNIENNSRPPPIIQNQNYNYNGGSYAKKMQKDISPLAAFERE